MAYYRTCPYCGCNLDPGEICDCRTEEKEAAPLPRETASGEKTPNLMIQVRTPNVKAVAG